MGFRHQNRVLSLQGWHQRGVSGNRKSPFGVGDVCPESFMNPKSPTDEEWPWSSDATKPVECISFQGELVSDQGSQIR